MRHESNTRIKETQEDSFCRNSDSQTKKGYLKIATGNYYHWLAKNLYNSYLLTQEEKLPFAVITDRKGQKKLYKYFDSVIEIVPTKNGFETKLNIDELSPFEKTIFIDADTLLTKDIYYWWDLFETSRESVSVFVNSWKRAGLSEPLLSEKAKKKYGLNRYLRFNGGVYYFDKSIESHAIFSRAKDVLKTYYDDEQPLFNGKPGDEPCMEIALLENGVYGVETSDKSQMYCTPNMSLIEINTQKRYCHCVKNEEDVYPSALHFGTNMTFGLQYRREVIRIKLELKKIPKQIWSVVEFIYITTYKLRIVFDKVISKIKHI